MIRILLIAALVITVSSFAARQMRNGKPGQNGNVEQTIRQLDRDWVKAYTRGDTAVLDRIYADDLIVTNPDGSVGNKAEELAAIKSGAFAFQSITNEDVRVRVFGEMAVVTGRSMMKGRYKDQDISGGYRYTDVYLKKRGRWQAVALQITRIAQQ
jgi:ketosteroid isomerase-like protein